MTSWRYIAQRAFTNEFLHWNLPLGVDELRWDLSGPSGLRATISPNWSTQVASDGFPIIDEWSTLIYAEQDGLIRWGGICSDVDFSGPSMQIDAIGMAGYPNGIPFLSTYSKYNIDPLDAVRYLWTYLNGRTNGNFGMTWDATQSPKRVGTKADPYALNWYEGRDIGNEIDALAKETPFDYQETHAWSGNQITHRLRLGYPRLGRKREDLAFVQGQNIAIAPSANKDGSSYANEVFAIGAGEGAKALRSNVGVKDHRIRRVYTMTDKRINTKARLDTFTRNELNLRKTITPEITEITVIDHTNARLPSWNLGDDILIQGYLPYAGDIAIWHRIVSWSLISENRAVLKLARSDTFRYG